MNAELKRPGHPLLAALLCVSLAAMAQAETPVAEIPEMIASPVAGRPDQPAGDGMDHSQILNAE